MTVHNHYVKEYFLTVLVLIKFEWFIEDCWTDQLLNLSQSVMQDLLFVTCLNKSQVLPEPFQNMSGRRWKWLIQVSINYVIRCRPKHEHQSGAY